GGRAAPALRGRDDVPGSGLAPKVLRAVRRAAGLAAGGGSRERMAEAGRRRARGKELRMAFEAFRAQAEAPRRGGRKTLWYALSIASHGVLIPAGVAYSFWHIEELSPPLLKVTFMSAAPPPPPAAPPPAGGGAAAKKKIVKPKPIVE